MSAPDLAVLVDPGHVARMLTSVTTSRFSGLPRLERAWPRDENGLSAVYWLGDECWGVHTTDGRIRRSVRAAFARGSAMPLQPGVWAHRLADDPGLPQLDAATSVSRSSRRLARWLSEGGSSSEPRPISYKPLRRCMIAYQGGALLGKAFAPGHDARVVDRHNALARTAGRPGLFCVPAPAGACHAWSMLLWRRSLAESLTDRLAKPEAERSVAAVGIGLAALQASNVPWEGRHGPDRELAVVDRWVRAASAARPVLRLGLGRVHRLFTRQVAGMHGGPLAPAHRDFHDGQLLVHEDRISLLDLDTACQAAPELDAGNFLAHLRLRQLQGDAPEADQLGRSFLAAHAGAAGPLRLSPERLRWYLMGALLRLACVYAFRPGWSRICSPLADAAIDGGGWNLSN